MDHSAAIDARARRPGVVLALAAAAPFAVGRLAGSAQPGEASLLPHIACPLRAMTGVPCPLCGATRSVVLAAHGDAAFLTFNPVWVVVLAALAVAGVALASAGARGVDVVAVRRRVPARAWWWAGALVAALAWTVAVAHRHAIAGA